MWASLFYLTLNAIYGARTPAAANYLGTAPDELMGAAAHDKNSKVSQKDVNAIAEFVLKNKDKNGTAIINSRTLAKDGKANGLAGPTDEQARATSDALGGQGYKVGGGDNKTTKKK